jgi:hypothetical protein
MKVHNIHRIQHHHPGYQNQTHTPLVVGDVWRHNSHDAYIKIVAVEAFQVQVVSHDIGHFSHEHVGFPNTLSIGELRHRYHHNARYN